MCKASRYWRVAASSRTLNAWRQYITGAQTKQTSWGWRDRSALLHGALAEQLTITSKHLFVRTKQGDVIALPMKSNKIMPFNVDSLSGQCIVDMVACDHYSAAVTQAGKLWLFDCGKDVASQQLPSKQVLQVPIFKAWDNAQSLDMALHAWLGWTMSDTLATWRDWLEAHNWMMAVMTRATFRWKHARMNHIFIHWRSRTVEVVRPRSPIRSPRSSAGNQKKLNQTM